MAKKKDSEEIIDNSRIIDGTFEQVMHNSMLPYSEHVILDRALPRVEDGSEKNIIHNVGAWDYSRQTA